MQLVTIKNSHYSNTLWLIQFGLILLAVVAVILAVVNDMRLLLSMPVLLLVLYTNQRTLSQQSQLSFAMRSHGQLVLINHMSGHLMAEMNADPDSDQEMTVEVKSFWHLPGVLMLQLANQQLSKPVYITLFRSVMGPSKFSHLLVGLTQLNDPLKINHEH